MHDCPDCGQACYCDGEDMPNDAGAEDCTHPETEYCGVELRDEDWCDEEQTP